MPTISTKTFDEKPQRSKYSGDLHVLNNHVCVNVLLAAMYHVFELWETGETGETATTKVV